MGPGFAARFTDVVDFHETTGDLAFLHGLAERLKNDAGIHGGVAQTSANGAPEVEMRIEFSIETHLGIAPADFMNQTLFGEEFEVPIHRAETDPGDA